MIDGRISSHMPSGFGEDRHRDNVISRNHPTRQFNDQQVHVIDSLRIHVRNYRISIDSGLIILCYGFSMIFEYCIFRKDEIPDSE